MQVNSSSATGNISLPVNSVDQKTPWEKIAYVAASIFYTFPFTTLVALSAISFCVLGHLAVAPCIMALSLSILLDAIVVPCVSVLSY